MNIDTDCTTVSLKESSAINVYIKFCTCYSKLNEEHILDFGIIVHAHAHLIKAESMYQVHASNNNDPHRIEKLVY